MTELDIVIDALHRLSEVKIISPAQRVPLAITEKPHEPDAVAQQVQALLIEGRKHQNADWAAHMTPPISVNSLIGVLLSALHNGNLLSAELYPTLQSIKQQTLSWLCQLFEQPHGHFTSGSSYGNLEALWQAKQRHPNRDTVYASQTAHYSIDKACHILGLKLQRIAADGENKITLASLKTACALKAPLAIIVTAGTSSTGNFDPVDECITIAKECNAWCHVDAAWGGYLKLLPECSVLFGRQLAHADSLCFDPHKAWGQPKPASILLYKEAASPMLSVAPDYLQQQPDNILPGSQGGEVFLPLWLSLVSSGIDNLRHRSRQALAQADSFSRLLRQYTNWTVFNSPSGIICFETQQQFESLIQQGVLSMAKRNNKLVYRVVFAGNATQADAIIEKLRPYF